MRAVLVGIITIGLSLSSLWAQSLHSPAEFLGYQLGSKFTFYHQIRDYLQHIAKQSPQVEKIVYGTSLEGRELYVMAVSSPQNLARKEEIRLNNRVRARLEPGQTQGLEIPVLWMSYNLHGDEAVSSESAMAFIHDLAKGGEDIDQWLEGVVLLIDPCANPDGHERYVNWYKQAATLKPSLSANSWEHQPPWPGGRFNHYLFDLNRDWCWQTQSESQQRLKLFRQWLPQVIADFHEMGYESPYFFAPAAHPYHEQITSWQLEFSRLMGANHSRYFNEKGWDFYTGKVFDLFYPSYGDTYGMFNGAVGFTYEQGGAGRAGRAVARIGDTLTLEARFEHHLTTSHSTLETVSAYATRLLEEQARFFTEAENKPPGPYMSYVVKGSNDPAALRAFANLLDRQEIHYGLIPAQNSRKEIGGYAYQKDSYGVFDLEPGDMVLTAYQPQSRLLTVLMEPHSKLEDSLTYDLTAWALPFAFGLEAYACQDRLDAPGREWASPHFPSLKEGQEALVTAWRDPEDIRFMSSLLAAGLKVYCAFEPFETNGRTFERGSMIISLAENPPGTAQTLKKIAQEQGHEVFAAGPMAEWELANLRPYTQPKVALIGGKGTVPTSFGEIWHFLEQDLGYPVDLLLTDYFSFTNLASYDVVILPSGNFRSHRAKLLTYVRQGGRLIVCDQAMLTFLLYQGEETDTQLAGAMEQVRMNKLIAIENGEAEQPNIPVNRYEDRDRTFLSRTTAGSIFRVDLREEDPLSFGYDGHCFLIKRNSQVYPFLPDSLANIGTFSKDSHISGFVGASLKGEVINSLAFGRETYGNGEIVYLTDSPIFRGFWRGGKLLLGNAIFQPAP